MKHLLVALLGLAVIGAAVVPEDADARRFGGGRSLGKQYSTPRQATPPRQAQQRPTAAQPGAAGARPSGASRWLGPLAGLAAGGLLASLFFGDAFEGFQIMDFLLIIALVVGGVFLFRMLRRRSAGPTPAAAGAGWQRNMPMGGGVETGGARPFGGGAMPGTPAAGRTDEAPVWFDAAGFTEGAKTHFIRLQAAWDQADFRDIREYTAPQLFAEIKRERDALGESPNYTEVVRLNAELLSVQRDSDQVIASVHFTGLIREEADGVANPLDEVWHVAHDWNTADGDWLIVGIQQPDQR
jgi:predicted lipid-binding transport protein (Tim44 family)